MASGIVLYTVQEGSQEMNLDGVLSSSVGSNLQSLYRTSHGLEKKSRQSLKLERTWERLNVGGAEGRRDSNVAGGP